MEYKVTDLHVHLKQVFDQADKAPVFISRHGKRYILMPVDIKQSLNQINKRLDNIEEFVNRLRQRDTTDWGA